MENYRRPVRREVWTSQALDGFIPAKTNRAPQKSRGILNAPQPRPRLQQQQRLKSPVIDPQPYRQTVLAQAPARRLPPIDMSLPEGLSSLHHYYEAVNIGRMSRLRKWGLRAAVALVVMVIGVGGVLGAEGYLKLHKVFKGNAAAVAALQKNVDPNLLKGEGDGRINVLLLGVGGQGHDGADLTDTIMLASIDPVRHTATLLSLPRDLWVNIPKNGDMKINAAYETGKYAYLGKETADNSNSQAIEAGFTSADQTVETVLGVPIDYNILVDFQAFRQAVNTVGGVTVNVPSDLYDPTMAWENHGNPYLARAGVQTMDGATALRYVRSRETSSDFARSQRQRAVLLALKQKAISLGVLGNPGKLSGLINAFGNNVKTDLSLGEANRLYSIFKQINNTNVNSISLAGNVNTTSSGAAMGSLVTTGDINGQSVVEPKAGLDNYGPIQAYVRSQLQDGYILREHAPVAVLNGTVQQGLAANEAATLKSYGYNVTTVTNAPTNTYQSTILVDLSHGKDPYTKHYLEQRFNVAAVTKLPDPTIKPGNARFVVLLGGDATTTN